MENLQQYSDKPTFESVWALFQETDRKFDKTQALLDKKFQETDRKFEETREQFKESQKEYDERMKETREELKLRDKQFTKRINQLEELFTSQWGKLVESLVNGDLVNLLKPYDIKVLRTSQREKGYFNDRQYEFDIIAKNGTDIVVVEVKTTLKVKHVKEFIANLKLFKEIMPEYSNKKIYGAIAYLQADEKSPIYADNQKLFVIRATGNSSFITNSKDFKPKAW